MLFDKPTYVERRHVLKQRMGSGLILLLGNNHSPVNYSANVYKFRQDSTFLYYLGLHRDGLAALIDVDQDEEWLIGNDIDVEDIVWTGPVPSMADMAAQSGVARTAPMTRLQEMLAQAKAQGRTIHFLPPYRHDLMIQLMDLLGIHPSQQREAASLPLIKAVIDQRAVKSSAEVAEIERACAIGYEMHTTAMRMCRPGGTEQEIAGAISDRILSGELHGEDRIPSVREYGADIGVNPNTVMRSYEKLTADGIIYNKRGIGYFVSADARDKILDVQRKDFLEKDVPAIKQRLALLGLNAEIFKD